MRVILGDETMYKFLIIGALLATVNCAFSAQQDSKIVFRHPSIIVDDARIKIVRKAIKEKAEPQTALLGHLINAARSYMKDQPNPSEKMFIPLYYQDKEKHIAARGKLDHDSDAVYVLALAYQLTEDGTYADKALEYLNAWAAKCAVGSPEGDTSLMTSRTLVLMVYGADLLWNYAGFKPDDRAAFVRWAKGTIDDTGLHRSKCPDNCGSWGIQAMTAYAILSENEEGLRKAVDLWKKHLEGNMDGKGVFKRDVLRHDGPKGQGISYSQFALHGYSLTAHICRHYGIDLFNWKAHGSATLKDAAVNIFQWERDPASFPYNKEYKQFAGSFYSCWEVLYGEYRVEEWKKKLVELRKEPMKYPFRTNEGGSWLTLTHGVPIGE